MVDLQAVDEVDHVVEATTGCDSDGHMRFAGAGTADQDGVTLLGDEAAAGEIIDQSLVDGCAAGRQRFRPMILRDGPAR